MVRAVAAMFGPSCEVVLHDLRRADASIVEIANGHISGRSAGASLMEGPLDDVALKSLLAPGGGDNVRLYETRTRDGRRLRSTTVIYRDRRGVPVAALCINYDLAGALAVQRLAADLLDFSTEHLHAIGHGDEETQGPRRRVSDVLASTIGECMDGLPRDPQRLSRQERLDVVRRLDERGVFLVRGAAYQVGRALGVSKFTIYTYLESIRDAGAKGGAR